MNIMLERIKQLDFKLFNILCLIPLLLILFNTGCASTGPAYDENRMLSQYYSQQRTYEPFSVKGAKEIIFRANEGQTVEMKVATPLDSLQQYAPPKNIGQQVVDTLGDVAKYGIIAGAACYGLDALASRQAQVVQPNVVKIPPTIVRPDVIVTK